MHVFEVFHYIIPLKVKEGTVFVLPFLFFVISIFKLKTSFHVTDGIYATFLIHEPEILDTS